MPSVMTMAVRTIACGSGSLICPSGSAPTIGGRPAAPPATRNSRFAPLPMRMTPMSTRDRLRSSSR